MVKRLRTHQGDSIEGERGNVLARTRSSTAADENDQRGERVDDDVPVDPPDLPPPPDEPANPSNVPPSVELEGRKSQ